MKTKEFFADLLDGEAQRFVRVVKALPGDTLDYKPDAKSRTALELANLIESEVHHIDQLLTTGEIDFSGDFYKADFKTTDEIAAAMEKSFATLKKTVQGMDDDTWMQEGAMKGAGEPWKMPRGVMAIHFFLDLVHHRGQLSTYIRPMGGKVPSIYGPSADSAA